METLLQRSRYEHKYLIDETCVERVREFARHYLVPDPYADPARGNCYCIYSIYLDNPRLDLLNATVEGHKNRFKLRARFYDEQPTSPVYFEIKRRANGTVLKERAKVRRAAANALLTPGVLPQRTDLVNESDDAGWSSLRKFCELRDKLGACGRCLVLYDREAWLTPLDNHVRLTFDRNVEGGPYDPRDPASQLLKVRRGADNPNWVRPPLGGVILELKYTDRFPNWMRELVYLFDLDRCSMAKYVKCVHQMRPERQERARHAARRRAERALLAGSSWEAMEGPGLAAFEIVARKGIEAPPPVQQPVPAVAVPPVKVLAERAGVELSPRGTAVASPGKPAAPPADAPAVAAAV